MEMSNMKKDFAEVSKEWFNKQRPLKDICPKCGIKLSYIIKEKGSADNINELIENNVSYVTDFYLENIFIKNKDEKPFYICYRCKDIYNNRFININKYYEDYWKDYEERNELYKNKNLTSTEFLKNVDKHLKMMEENRI